LKGWVKSFVKDSSATQATIKPVIIPRSEHNISRKLINKNALKVLYRLHDAGYSAFLVGGCVRDLLLEKIPKDFDIATNAEPDEVRSLFRNCRLIGRRFRLAHILFGQDIIEVATFRTHHENAAEGQHAKMHDGMIIRDNVYGTIEDDAQRRDFTINALYYNIADFSVWDFTGGMQDLQKRALRVIGNPTKRFTEDPVRMLRAIRFLGKLDINMSPETEAALVELRHLVKQVSPSRLFQETLKLFQEGRTAESFKQLQKYEMFSILFPPLYTHLNEDQTNSLLNEVLHNTDFRIHEGKTISPAFLFAAILWQPILHNSLQLKEDGMSPYVALEKSIQKMLKIQTESLAIPRILSTGIREICVLQYHLTQRSRSRVFRTLHHQRFRAAFDLLSARAKSGEEVSELSNWWEQFQAADALVQETLLKEAQKTLPKKRGRSRSKRTRKIKQIE